ncbi:P1 family peptidase [Mesorhizobium atlanticum]
MAITVRAISFWRSRPPIRRRQPSASGRIGRAEFIPDVDIDPFFDAVVQSVEEAILNALVANEDMTGRDGNFVPALPKDWLKQMFG